MEIKIRKYIEIWKDRGYTEDIPDEVPEKLMQLGLAPSYKAIALAVLQNDHALISLGFPPPKSQWYNKLKRIELAERNKDEDIQ